MRMVIVEDSNWMRQEIESRSFKYKNLHIVGTASEEKDAVNLISGMHPDVILIDLGLTSGSALDVLKRVREVGQTGMVLALSKIEHGRVIDLQGLDEIGRPHYQNSELSLLMGRINDLLEIENSKESKRLSALENLCILDTPEEGIFDEITRLAGAIVGAPIALISLIDETRQWFKSHIGLDVRETSRDISFCQFAIKQTDVFVVEDALLDDRFKDNPLVIGEPHIRFYAGMPIVLGGGEVIGTLCVVDFKPNRLSELQALSLQVLTNNITAELEKRAHISALNEEIVRRKDAEIRIMHIATHDRLTNLPNRAALHENLKQAIKLAERSSTGVVFLYIDLDRFKRVNDTLGHNVGDFLLTDVCQRMSSVLRDSDSIARMGGDEFAVVLSDVNGLESAQQIATKIIAAVSDPFVYHEHRFNISCSIGIALYPMHGIQVNELIRHADLAMYQAKKQGGGMHQVFVDSLQLAAEERMNLEIDLRKALIGEELMLYYQPKMKIDHETLVGAEALVRWTHPQLGILGADRFINIAEDTGQIIALGQYVLNAALFQLASWDKTGLCLQQIAVNVSPQQLCHGFPQIVETLLLKYEIPPNRLELEITETSLTRDAPDMFKVLNELRALGVCIAVDDFGVGYSSLALLRNLPVNTLKIDRSFVCELGLDTQDAAIIRAIVVMAHALKMRTVAEGVETQYQYSTLKALGCDVAQGNLYGTPMIASDFLNWANQYAE